MKRVIASSMLPNITNTLVRTLAALKMLGFKELEDGTLAGRTDSDGYVFIGGDKVWRIAGSNNEDELLDAWLQDIHTFVYHLDNSEFEYDYIPLDTLFYDMFVI